jgi:hypothetical protein
MGASSVSAPAFTLPVVFSSSTAFREQIARVGLNYHFGWGDLSSPNTEREDNIARRLPRQRRRG